MSGGPALPRILFHFARAQWAFTHLLGERLARYHDARARRIVRYAAAHSPFYRAHWEGCDLRDWRALPPVDKRRMMAEFSRFNTAGIVKEDALAVALRAEESRDFAPTLPGGLTVGLSSGTSGHRGLFLVSPTETAAWAGTVLARTLHGVPPRGYRVAFFLRSNSNLYERVGASRRVVFRWFDLMTPLPEAVARLNDYGPQMLVGPPSLLLLLAGASRRGELRAHPARLVSVAEVLEPQDRERLEAAFGVPVHQVYQATEGLLGASCPHGQLHVQEDLVAVQYEALGEPSPPAPLPPRERGVRGTARYLPLPSPAAGEGPGVRARYRVSPVVTDLWRTTQPIVRYRLGDVLRLAPEDAAPCPCGSAFRVIEAIEGRCDDVCWFPCAGGGPLRPFFPDTIRRIVLLADARIADYAAEQECLGHLRLFLETEPGTPFDAVAATVREKAERTVSQYGCVAERIEVQRGVPAPSPGAKRRRVRCLAGPEA